MQLGLDGRVALVTGGSKGIGRAIAEALAGEGASVALVARGSASLEATTAAVERVGGTAIALEADVTSDASAKAAVRRTFDRFGRLDILVNNAGGAIRFGGFHDLTANDWRRAFDLNVLGIVNFVAAAEPHLRASPAPRIINISSISATQPGHFNPHYSAAKAAAVNLSKHLANVFAGAGILVNAICAGPTHSASWDQNIEQVAARRGIPVEDWRAEVERVEAAKIPIGRIGEGSDIAGMVAFLASDRAVWITGSCFHINGGKLAGIW